MTRPEDEPRKRPQERGRSASGRPAAGAGGDRSGRPSGGSGRPGSFGARRPAQQQSAAGPAKEWTYDPRREARRQMARVPLPDDVEARDLDRDVRKELMSLAKDTAELVARHLVMAGRLMDTEPAQALAHARAARALAGRVGAVREANGLVAYTAGEWSEALSELRTARRLSGDPEHLPIMADCERALGRPDRALQVAEDPQAASLSPSARVELLIVASGARRDLGQAEAAVVSLQVGALEGPVRPWTARLRYAYADALLDAGREDEARQWFARTADVDEAGETDAEDRLLELDGMVLDDLEGDLEDEQVHAHEPMSSVDLVALVADMSTPRPSERVEEVPATPSEPVLETAPVPFAAAAEAPGVPAVAFAASEAPEDEPARPIVPSVVALPGFQAPAGPEADDELTLFD